ncbi:hypothetical protein Tco_0710991 [Tanacetum coccineum]
MGAFAKHPHSDSNEVRLVTRKYRDLLLLLWLSKNSICVCDEDLRCDLKRLLGFGLYSAQNPWCLSFMLGVGIKIRNVEGIVDISEVFRKFKFICHWANPFKDFERSNVPGIRLSSFSELDNTFTSLSSDVKFGNYLFWGLHDDFSGLDEMCGFSEAINNDPDCVMSV